MMYFTNQTRLSLSNKSKRLFHVNLLLQITMKKGIFYVKMVKRPMENGINSKEKTNSNDISHRRKSFIVVEAINLSVPLIY